MTERDINVRLLRKHMGQTFRELPVNVKICLPGRHVVLFLGVTPEGRRVVPRRGVELNYA